MRYQRNPNVIVTDLQDEIVLLEPSKKQMFTLNITGRIVWQSLESLQTDAIVQKIRDEFEIDQAQASEDVHELLMVLKTKELIQQV